MLYYPLLIHLLHGVQDPRLPCGLFMPTLFWLSHALSIHFPFHYLFILPIPRMFILVPQIILNFLNRYSFHRKIMQPVKGMVQWLRVHVALAEKLGLVCGFPQLTLSIPNICNSSSGIFMPSSSFYGQLMSMVYIHLSILHIHMNKIKIINV